MEPNRNDMSRTRMALWLGVPVCVAALVLAVSCTNFNGGGGGGNVNENSNDSGTPTRDAVLNLKTSFPVSGRGAITIQYSAIPPATVSAFYVEVESATPGAPDKGAPVIFATNLPAGTLQSVTLIYDDLPVGVYKVGIYIDRPSGRTEVRCEGFLIIESPPSPIFTAPTSNTEIKQGDVVDIGFNNRKTPASRVRWRLFYKSYDVRDSDRDGVINALDQCPGTSTEEQGQVDSNGCSPSQLAAGSDFDADGVLNGLDVCPGTQIGASVDQAGCSEDQLGTQLAIGEGNESTFKWDTTGVSVGNYRVGISATDSGQSISSQFAVDSSRIVTVFNNAVISIGAPPPPPQPPTLVFTRPIKDVGTFLTEDVLIEFQATVRNVGAVGKVSIFLDTDTTPNNGNERVLLTDAPTSTTSVSFSTGPLSEGTYNIGGTVIDNVSPAVTVYAAARVIVVKTPSLTVSAPDSPLPVRPGSSVDVVWTTNVPSHAAQLDVYAQRLDANGQPTGPEIVIRPPGPPFSGSDSAVFTPAESGIYRVFVRMNFNDTSVQTLQRNSPRDVRATTLPAVVWVGGFGLPRPLLEGTIWGGVNFEDNFGTNMVSVPDLNGDGISELLVVARYGKPGFKNPSGVGEGEAYLIYGGPRTTGEINANTIGKSKVGITFTGIRTRLEPPNREQTHGLSSIAVLPDLDNDGLPELAFGFPRTKSRGHNVDPRQDGLTPDNQLRSLERPDQFLRGGVVIVSSKNTNLQAPDDDRLSPVIRLDLVGQQFQLNEPPFSGLEEGAFWDVRGYNPCVDIGCMCDMVCPDGAECPPTPEEEDTCAEYCGEIKCSELCRMMGDFCKGDCLCQYPDGQYDGMSPEGASTGFVGPLADTWYERYYCRQNWDCGLCVGTMAYPVPVCNYVYNPMTCPDPLHQNNVCRTGGCYPFKPIFSDVGLPGQSGFYPTWIQLGQERVRNEPLEPYGARIIGLSTYGGVNDGDHFGTSMTFSNAAGTGTGSLIVTAPDRRRAIPTLGLNQRGECVERAVDGEVGNMLDTTGDGCPDPIDFPGIAYMFDFEIENRQGQRRPYNLWEDDPLGRIPPKPHQYMIGTPSHCENGVLSGLDGIPGRIENPDVIHIIGQANERLKNVLGVDDFNGDGRDDIAAGVPEANGGKGTVYVAYRREPRIEGDYVMGNLALAPNNPNRIDGIYVTQSGDDPANFGASLATGVDFNQDGLSDLVVGAPLYDVSTDQQGQKAANVGAVVIIFSNPELVTPQGGLTVDQLIATRRAVRIVGNFLDVDGNFGFNVASGGDIDGDGTNDLVIAAPGATPRFDPTPTDPVDILSEPGLDLDFDGRQDNIATLFGLANFDNSMTRAGVVYVISGANDFRAGGEISVRNLGSANLRGVVIAGRRAFDYLGGGDAGDTNQGGNDKKLSRGRSSGLASAGDLDGDGRADLAIGAILADPRRDRITGEGVRNGGEMYVIYGGTLPSMR